MPVVIKSFNHAVTILTLIFPWTISHFGKTITAKYLKLIRVFMALFVN